MITINKRRIREHVFNAFILYKFKKICSNCRKYGNIVHHKDTNGLNNKKSNLEILCRSCHQKHHVTGKNNPMYGIRLTGKMNGMYGRKHSKKTIKKMRKSIKLWNQKRKQKTIQKS